MPVGHQEAVRLEEMWIATREELNPRPVEFKNLGVIYGEG
jgi:hypothetical protein